MECNMQIMSIVLRNIVLDIQNIDVDTGNMVSDI